MVKKSFSKHQIYFVNIFKLVYSLCFGLRDAVKAMLESDKWYDMLYHATWDPATGSRDTPMRKLIRFMPDMAGVALEKCTTENDRPDGHEEFEITYNYELLDDLFVDYNKTGNTKKYIAFS